MKHPNPPSLRDGFDKSRRQTNSPVSQGEHDQLIKHRATPRMHAHPSPDGMTAQSVNTAIETAREARITFISKRLKQQRSIARKGFNRAH